MTPPFPLLLYSLSFNYDMSLLNDLCIRVTVPWQDCSGAIQKWVSRSNKAVVYEHDADEEVSRTHIHMALIGCDVKAEALKRMWPDAPGKGNELWSFSPPRNLPQYFKYMTKGKLSPVLVKNIPPDEIERHRTSWVEEVNPDKSEKAALEFYVKKVVSRFIVDGQFNYVDHHSFGGDLFNDVRKATMSVFWGAKRTAPHATQYKQVASTAYLRIMEHCGRLDDGFERVMERWY